MQTYPLRLAHSLLFFDLAGTVVEQDAPVTERVGRVLRRVGARLHRLVMVTGQPRADGQVQAMLSMLADCPAAETVYVTRGGVRLFRRNGEFRVDADYRRRFALDPAEIASIRSAVVEVLAETGIKPLIPISTLEGVTVRVNVMPHLRERLLEALRPRLGDLQAEAEGRTSVYVSKIAMDKQSAVRFELSRSQTPGPVYYLGNEVADGNDRPVLAVAGVEVLAVGGCGQVPSNARCRTVAESVDDVLTMLEASI